MWKGKIEQSTKEECREAYVTGMHLAYELLKQKKIEKTEVEKGSGGNVVPDDQIDNESKGHPGEHSEWLKGNAEAGSIGDAVINSLANHEQSGSILNGNLLDPTVSASSLSAAVVKFRTYLKRFRNLQMFMVIGFCLILLLMQLSIVVLLSRPQQIYVVPQASRLSSMDTSGGQQATGALHWLKKRMHLLKDELLVVNSQLERIHNKPDCS